VESAVRETTTMLPVGNDVNLWHLLYNSNPAL
jgi:hypothetical protein